MSPMIQVGIRVGCEGAGLDGSPQSSIWAWATGPKSSQVGMCFFTWALAWPIDEVDIYVNKRFARLREPRGIQLFDDHFGVCSVARRDFRRDFEWVALRVWGQPNQARMQNRRGLLSTLLVAKSVSKLGCLLSHF